jgi:hypothetical protein
VSAGDGCGDGLVTTGKDAEGKGFRTVSVSVPRSEGALEPMGVGGGVRGGACIKSDCGAAVRGVFGVLSDI